MGKSVNTNLRPGSSGGSSSSSELSGQGRFDEGSGFSKPEQSSNQVQQQTASSSGNQASSEPAVDADEEKRKAADRKMSTRERLEAKRGRTYELKPHDSDEVARRKTEYEMEQERLEREALAPSVKPAAEPIATASSAVEESAEAEPSGNGVTNDEARAVLAELDALYRKSL